MGKTFFVDLTKCTACRGCQVACKQWKKLPAEKTVNSGSHQNPPDLSGSTLKLVRFKEQVIDGKLNWLFLPEQCRHCIDPPCVASAQVDGSMIHDEVTGAVIYTDKSAKENYQDIRDSCPYDIPRQDPATGVLMKCDMCNDRVHAGMLPSCVLSCPTGAMDFGDRVDMLNKAERNLAAAKGKYPQAQLVDLDDVRVIYLAAVPVQLYHEKLSAYGASNNRRGPLSRKEFLAKLGSPIKRMTS
ncbi:MAG: formate dehydrogenase [Proteobacteria bacterium]|nr:formate dehydrogenase [Pseudomonadota bacterium]